MAEEFSNKLWRDFATTKKGEGGITPDDYDALKLASNITAENRDFFTDLLLTGWLSGKLSSSGPMPGTIQFKSVNGVNAATSYIDFGEGVWVVQDIIAIYTGGSGTITFRAYHYDGTTPLEWVYGSTTSSTLFVYNADAQFSTGWARRYGGSTSAENYMQLGVKPSGTFTADSMTIYAVCYRER